MAATLSRASALAEPVATIQQRKVQAKSTIHDEHSPAGHDNSSSSDSDSDEDLTSTFTPPSFSVKDLLGCIPKHCFERSALRSFSYLFTDFAMEAALTYAATYIDGLFNYKNGLLLDGYAGTAARVLSWAAYALCTGTIGFGIWVIGHECGHQAFSTSKTLNNTVGLILHSMLLTPYHSWRISHARHHAGTGSMERDEVFIPFTRSELGLRPAHAHAIASGLSEPAADKKSTFEVLDDLFEDAPFWTLTWLLVQQFFGWPAYLLKNASGQPYPEWVSHFDPKAVIFDKKHFTQIVLSDIGVFSMIGVLSTWIYYRSFTEVLCYYFVPWLVLNHTLVLVTFLQHTDINLPHYRNSEWTFPRGALCTIDRNLGGKIGAFFLHGICETHVAHHISSRIPHYHAWEATEALKSVLGDYYMKSDDNMYYSLVKNYQECRFVEDEGGCVFYKNKHGKSARRVVYEEDSAVALDDTTSGSEQE